MEKSVENMNDLLLRPTGMKMMKVNSEIVVIRRFETLRRFLPQVFLDLLLDLLGPHISEI